MSQIDDLKLAISNELADVKSLLDKLASMSVVQSDPVVSQAITDLQASHTQIQSVLNPIPVATPAA
jgi:hypothetical protein